MKYLKKRLLSFFMAVVLFASLVSLAYPETAVAAGNVTRAKFIELVVKELGLTIDKKETLPYIAAALKEGIITKTTFGGKPDYNTALSKSDAVVILVRADEYLNGVTVSDELVQTIIEKRISDIGKVSDARKPYVAKAFAMGYLSGSSNGAYSTNRKLAPSGKMSLATAKTLVERIKDKSKRVPMSPDGQVLRTTKLPSNAKMYPYILASYPNAYYDWEFHFMKWFQGTPIYGTSKWVNLKDYAAPVDIARYQDGIYYNEIKEAIPVWEGQLKKYLEAVFNVDYRTIEKDKEWYQTILENSENYGTIGQRTVEFYLDNYIDLMVKNKTVIECDKIAFDISTLYIDSGNKIVRIYVHYRINSSVGATSKEAMDEWFNSALFYTGNVHVDLDNMKLGQWRDGYFDVELNNRYTRSVDGVWFTGYGIRGIMISDYYYRVKVVK